MRSLRRRIRLHVLLLGGTMLATGCAYGPDLDLVRSGASDKAQHSEAALARYNQEQDVWLSKFAARAQVTWPVNNTDKAKENERLTADIKGLETRATAIEAAIRGLDELIKEQAVILTKLSGTGAARVKVEELIKALLVDKDKLAAALGTTRAQIGALTTMRSEIDNERGTLQWHRVFLAGAEYIDEVCKLYLTDLFWMARSRDGAIELITIGAAAAGTIGALSGMGAAGLGILAAAFGVLGGGTQTIYNTLLYELDPTAVFTLVEQMQASLREYYSRPENQIITRLGAVGALKTYMSKCTPLAIEAKINEVLKKTEFKAVDTGTQVQMNVEKLIQERMPKSQPAGNNTSTPEVAPAPRREGTDPLLQPFLVQ